MENRNLGRGQVSVPVVGLGTWRRLEAAAAAGRHRELISATIAAGIALFDTSPMYGDAERLLAAALDGQRGQVLIADKIWTPSAEEGAAQLGRAVAWWPSCSRRKPPPGWPARPSRSMADTVTREAIR
jgi:aryl-alcohol dehydrogenase-like predicted oxidoreductase